MDEKDVKNISKFILIGAVILCIVSLLLPWNGFSMNIMGMNTGADFYPWGGHAYVDYGALSGFTEGQTSFDVWSLFYQINIGAPSTGTEEVTTTQEAGATALFALSFIFVIITLIFGLIAFKSIKQK